jgi:hypothetical protein
MEALVSGPRHLEVESAILELKSVNCQVMITILAELIKAEGETLVSEIHKLIYI